MDATSSVLRPQSRESGRERQTREPKGPIAHGKRRGRGRKEGPSSSIHEGERRERRGRKTGERKSGGAQLVSLSSFSPPPLFSARAPSLSTRAEGGEGFPRPPPFSSQEAARFSRTGPRCRAGGSWCAAAAAVAAHAAAAAAAAAGRHRGGGGDPGRLD